MTAPLTATGCRFSRAPPGLCLDRTVCPLTVDCREIGPACGLLPLTPPDKRGDSPDPMSWASLSTASSPYLNANCRLAPNDERVSARSPHFSVNDSFPEPSMEAD